MNAFAVPAGLAQASVQAGLLALVLLGLRLAFGQRVSARLFCIGWCLVALRLVLPTVPGVTFSPLAQWSRGVAEAKPGPTTIVLLGAVPESTVSATHSVGVWATPGFFADWTLARVLAALWIAGLVLLLARLLLNACRASSFRSGVRFEDGQRVRKLLEECRARAGVRSTVALAFSERLNTPALIGWFRPVIVLPVGLSERLNTDELRCVLLHELMHVRRHDIALNWLSSVLLAVHWFNPLVWMAFRCWRADREILCDRAVLRVVKKPQRAAYRNALLVLLESAAGPALAPCEAGLFQSKWELTRRISFMTSPRAFTLRHTLGCLLILALTGPVVFTRAQETPVPPAPKEEPNPIPARETHSTPDVELRIYDVRDLTEVKPEQRLFKDKNAQPAAAPVATSPQALVEKAKSLVAGEQEARVDYRAGNLLVLASPAAHAKLDAALSGFRKELGTPITFETRFFSMGSESLNSFLKKSPKDANTHIELSAADVEELLKAVAKDKSCNLLTAPRLTVVNKQRAHVLVGDFPGDATAQDIDHLRGVALEVRPVLSADHRSITYEAEALLRNDERTMQLKQTLTVPDRGGNLLVLGCEPKNGMVQTTCVLIQPFVVEEEAETAP